MRPTAREHQTILSDENNIPIDPALKNGPLLSDHEAEVWLEFAAEAIGGLSRNHDATANNQPTTITDEACLMADRMLLAYRARRSLKDNNDNEE